MQNPYSTRWTNEIHKFSRGGEKQLAIMEAQRAEDYGFLVCPKCGEKAWYRPGVGAYWCAKCNDPVRE